MIRIYLAGPEVFLANALEIGKQKKALCAKYGFIGVFPLDNEITDCQNYYDTAMRISASNEDLIKSCSYMIANLTSFRGPSADAGTVYEVGFGVAYKLKVFGYTNDNDGFYQRSFQYMNYFAKNIGKNVTCNKTGITRDGYGMSFEDF
jgi:nucleoside 2-deoxyribosyltransferase